MWCVNSITEKETAMKKSTQDFPLDVSAVTGHCPAGEVYAKQNIAEKCEPISNMKFTANAGRSKPYSA
jgi:hypothetical protein